jgi:RNA polymerase sigma-70 factor, ECF subfamily
VSPGKATRLGESVNGTKSGGRLNGTRLGKWVDRAVLGERFDVALAAARTGEEWAWRAFYKELAPRVQGYLRARGGELDSDDLVGEVFLQLTRDLSSFEGSEAEFRAWVMTIAHHRLLDERRRRSSRPTEVAAPEELPESPGGDVEEEALARMEEERVHRALAGLSEEQRSVLLLRILGDLTVEQVACALGKSPGAVKALQRRGLEALKTDFSRPGVTI